MIYCIVGNVGTSLEKKFTALTLHSYNASLTVKKQMKQQKQRYDPFLSNTCKGVTHKKQQQRTVLHVSCKYSMFEPKGPHTQPRLKPTASCLHPTSALPLVSPVQQKSCIEQLTAANSTAARTFCACLVPLIQNMKTGNDGTECKEKQSAHSIPPLPHTALIR